MKRIAILASACLLAACTTTSADGPAADGASPNASDGPISVVLFISDGASYETWNMAGYWARGERDGAPWSDWPVKLGMTTFPLNTSRTPTMNDTPMVTYDPALAWSTAPAAPDLKPQPPAFPGEPTRVYPSPFAGYQWVKKDYADSAAAGTALSTGIKTYNNAISVDNFGRDLGLVTDAARRTGRLTGTVTSVPFSHATPAVFGANNRVRDNYHEIARDMLRTDRLDVVIGAGHPDYDDNGRPRTPDYSFVAPAEWSALKAGEIRGRFVDAHADIRALADGSMAPPDRLVVVPRAGSTLQFARKADVAGKDAANPSGVAFNRDMPDLPVLTRVALNRLGRHDRGFFLMVEGGAVDWGAHSNQTGRMIEEQLDFEASVTATIDWLRQRGRLDRTLLIVLTDHGNGLPLGPDSDRIAWQPVENRGRGKLPGVRWHSGTHTNEVTRMWAMGPGSECLANFVQGTDPGLRDIIRHNADGRYIDNTAIMPVMVAALEGKPCPQPNRTRPN
jgi:alkaline phosphatase